MKRYLTVLVIALILLPIWLTPGSAAGGVPTDQIKSTVDKALVVLRDPRFKPTAKTKERREQLKQILFTRFDFTEMAKRSLGANWRRRTPKEQEEFVRLFTDLLERAYADTIESYGDEKIVYVGERLDGGYADISSKVLTSKGEEFSLNYRAHFVGGEWRVYDVVVENISMVNNYRSQFNRVISNSSFDELVRRLKDKASFATQKH
ncbi:MAG: ABC transporter substrate-binding protein [Deltaproteobacteria bacterium]|nr:ABC transporter substrate-binding protein [Deltaproteobacteria bacterium]MDZ4343935.1 ABC transporter substrate-binding protein [Candidatus Binatia bacterium]